MVRKMRSLVCILCFLFFGVGALLLNWLVFPFIMKNKELCSDIIHLTWKFFIRFLCFLKMIRLDIRNIGEIRNKVIVCSHPSFIDIVILIGLIPRSTCFVKKELAHNPVLNNLVNSIFITNETELEEMKEASRQMLERGFNVIIFPSGIRHRRNEFPKIKKGAATIAMNSGKDIVPVKMYTSEDFLFINQPFYAVGEKTVVFEIEEMPEIIIADFISTSEILTKKEITKAIEKSLYD